jgi:hypothetical protein
MATTVPTAAEQKNLFVHLRPVDGAAATASGADKVQNVVEILDLNAPSATAQDVDVRRRTYVTTINPTDVIFPNSKIGDRCIVLSVEKTAGVFDASTWIKKDAGWCCMGTTQGEKLAFVGEHTCTAASEQTVLVTGMVTTDKLLVATFFPNGDTNRTLVSYASAKDQFKITLCGAATTNQRLLYRVVRA